MIRIEETLARAVGNQVDALIALRDARADVARLTAEVDRLTKANDADWAMHREQIAAERHRADRAEAEIRRLDAQTCMTCRNGSFDCPVFAESGRKLTEFGCRKWLPPVVLCECGCGLDISQKR